MTPQQEYQKEVLSLLAEIRDRLPAPLPQFAGSIELPSRPAQQTQIIPTYNKYGEHVGSVAVEQIKHAKCLGFAIFEYTDGMQDLSFGWNGKDRRESVNIGITPNKTEATVVASLLRQMADAIEQQS